MKIKKKTAMFTSLVVGIAMFTTTVMAEVVSKSPYEQAKDSIKYSAEAITTKLQSYTADYSMVLKDNGKVVMSSKGLDKADNIKKSKLSTTSFLENGKKKTSMYYADKKGYISGNKDGVYYEGVYEQADEGVNRKNPFNEKGASDIEKIIDAIVGNLKDYVVSTEKSDGSKELSGSISEAQIPTLINAVTSYMIKNNTSGLNAEENNLPAITKDVYVKDVNGKMLVDKKGLIQSIFGTAVFHGVDNKGKEHELTAEVLIKLSNINSTVVTKPNLTGKKVEKTIVNNGRGIFRTKNPERYIGKYKGDVVINKDGKFKKIGERIITISSCSEKSISGMYEENYFKGYEEYANDCKFNKVKFNGEYNEQEDNFKFKVDNMKSKGNIRLDGHSPIIYFNLPVENNPHVLSTYEYNKVFE